MNGVGARHSSPRSKQMGEAVEYTNSELQSRQRERKRNFSNPVSKGSFARASRDVTVLLVRR